MSAVDAIGLAGLAIAFILATFVTLAGIRHESERYTMIGLCTMVAAAICLGNAAAIITGNGCS